MIRQWIEFHYPVSRTSFDFAHQNIAVAEWVSVGEPRNRCWNDFHWLNHFGADLHKLHYLENNHSRARVQCNRSFVDKPEGNWLLNAGDTCRQGHD